MKEIFSWTFLKVLLIGIFSLLAVLLLASIYFYGFITTQTFKVLIVLVIFFWVYLFAFGSLFARIWRQHFLFSFVGFLFILIITIIWYTTYILWSMKWNDGLLQAMGLAMLILPLFLSMFSNDEIRVYHKSRIIFILKREENVLGYYLISAIFIILTGIFPILIIFQKFNH